MVRLFAFAAWLLLLVPVPLARADASCQFVLGFRALAAAVPQVGACLDNESHNPANGDAIQHTSGGLLVWRKADNWTAFTDGAHTWINGPDGLAERGNNQRFSWEAPGGWQDAPDCLVTPLQVGARTRMDLSGTCSIPLSDADGPRDLTMLLFATSDSAVSYFVPGGALNTSLVTPRLLARLVTFSTTPPGAMIGAPPAQAVLTQQGNGGLPTLLFSTIAQTPSVAFVDVRPAARWYVPYEVIVVVVPTPAGWRVDDVRCAAPSDVSLLTTTTGHLACAS